MWFMDGGSGWGGDTVVGDSGCSDFGFREHYFNTDLLLLALVLSLVTNLGLRYFSKGFRSGTAATDEESFLATHWSRMLDRDKGDWNNPRTFHVAGKMGRLQLKLDKKIKPTEEGCLRHAVLQRVPKFFAGWVTGAVSQAIRVAVYAPFVVWNWGTSLGTVPNLGPVGNVLSRRLFALPDCAAGSLSLLSWLLLADVVIRYSIDRFFR